MASYTYEKLKYSSKCRDGKTLTPEYSSWLPCFGSSASFKSGKSIIFENVLEFDSNHLKSLTVKTSVSDPQLEACWKKAAETYLIKHPIKDLRDCTIIEVFGASSVENDRYLINLQKRLNPRHLGEVFAFVSHEVKNILQAIDVGKKFQAKEYTCFVLDLERVQAPAIGKHPPKSA